MNFRMVSALNAVLTKQFAANKAETTAINTKRLSQWKRCIWRKARIHTILDHPGQKRSC